MSFQSKPLNKSQLSRTLSRHPFLSFGLPFLITIVTSSFLLSNLTQTRYDLRDQKVHAVSKEEELGMKKGRRKFDVREEYFRLQATGDQLGELDDWENKRVERLPGQDEWGALPPQKSK